MEKKWKIENKYNLCLIYQKESSEWVIKTPTIESIQNFSLNELQSMELNELQSMEIQECTNFLTHNSPAFLYP